MKTLISVTTLIVILVLIRAARANEVNPLADLPWQTTATQWLVMPYQGDARNYMHAATQVDKPIGPGSLFESIDWYHAANNLNAGSMIEQSPIGMGLVWWDFSGGHHVFTPIDGEYHLNSELPLRLSYIEITYGYPGPNHESWWQIPAQDGLLGLTQVMPGVEGGWVTHIDLFTRDVKAGALPDSGTTILFLAIGVIALVIFKSHDIRTS